MKKLLAILLALSLLCCAGCGQEGAPAAPEAAPAAEASAEPAPAPETKAEPAAPAAEPEAEAEPAAEPAPEPVSMPDTVPAPEALIAPTEFPLLEEPPLPAALRVPGDWYALHQGVLLQLSVKEDGSFVLGIPGAVETQTAGTWRVEDNSLWLGDEETEPLLVLDDSLLWASAGLSFTREQPQTYVPAEEFYDLQPGDADGYWVCRYAELGGVRMPAEAMGGGTALVIEGENVALGGDFFGDLPLVFSYEDGGMLAAVGEAAPVTLAIQLQQDGFLRLTLRTADDETVIFYLSPQTPADAELPEG